MAATKYLDYDGLLYFWGKLKTLFNGKADNSAVVHITGAETITGSKTFTGSITLTQDIESPHVVRLDSNSNGYAGMWDSTNSKWMLYSNDSGDIFFKGTADAAPWSGITGKPSSFTPSSHVHGDITNDGKLGTASRAVVTDGNKKIAVSSVTSTELGYLSGVTSGIQTQLGTKAADSAVVHLAGSETVTGSKTFTGNAIFTSSDTTPHNISIGANTGGSSGIWDSLYSKWMLYSNSSGEAFFKGTADAAPWSGITSKPTTVSGYGITDAYTKTEVDAKLTSAMHYKGSVATYADLPSSGNQTGDFYNVTSTGENYAWTGSAWDVTGSIVDLAAITNAEIDTVVAS